MNHIFWHQYIPVQIWDSLYFILIVLSLVVGISFVLGVFFKERKINE